jgi:hypothetical protein
MPTRLDGVDHWPPERRTVLFKEFDTIFHSCPVGAVEI